MTLSFINLSEYFLIHLFSARPVTWANEFLKFIGYCVKQQSPLFILNVLKFQSKPPPPRVSGIRNKTYFVNKSLVTFSTPFVISSTSPSSLHICRLETESLGFPTKEVLHPLGLLRVGTERHGRAQWVGHTHSWTPRAMCSPSLISYSQFSQSFGQQPQGTV